MSLEQTPREGDSACEQLARRAVLRAALGLGVAALAVPAPAFAKVLLKDPKVLVKSPKIIAKSPKLLVSKASRQISLLNLHTGERLNAEYVQNGRYVSSALRAVSVLLRDHYNNKTHAIDPRLLDLAVALHRRVGSNAQFNVVCGYRSPETNAMMHEESSGVAVHSMHIEGKAIDIRLPGTRLGALRKSAVAMKLGGVGFYPDDDFVHIDTGKVRRWVG
jgi:uncharacterized protein YcbK (DUF882 family)